MGALWYHYSSSQATSFFCLTFSVKSQRFCRMLGHCGSIRIKTANGSQWAPGKRWCESVPGTRVVARQADMAGQRSLEYRRFPDPGLVGDYLKGVIATSPVSHL